MEKRKSVEYATLAEDRSISTVVQEQQEQQRLVASETRQGIMALFVVEVSFSLWNPGPRPTLPRPFAPVSPLV